MVRSLLLGACILGALLGCSTSSPPPPPAAPAAPAEPPPAPRPEVVAPSKLQPVSDPRLQEPFGKAGLRGTIAVYDTTEGVVRCGDLDFCATGYLPASTFKIANTLIALENGVVSSAEDPLRWDGQTHEVAAWNQDHTVRSAFRVSCVPCFQQIAREIGDSRMQDWLARLDYGNHDCSGSIDSFWLGGQLRITALEQLDFLWRLDSGALPLRAHSLDIIRSVMEIESRGERVLRGKTGWAPASSPEGEVAWFVGWLELAERRAYFATVIDGRPPEVDLATARQQVTEEALGALGLTL